MVRFFGHSMRLSVLLLGIIEALTVYAAIFVIATLVVHSPDGPSGLTSAAALPALLTILMMLALGIYEPDARADLATMTERLGVACVVGAGLGFGIVYMLGDIWVSPLYAIACASFSYGAVAIARFTFGKMLRYVPLQRRILVLGNDAAGTSVRETARLGSGDSDVVAVIAPDATDTLLEQARALDVSEIVVADRSAPLPASALLDCKAAGMRIHDSLDFGELETGKVDLENLYPGRFIFSRNVGYAIWSMRAKRAMDVLVSAIAVIVLSPVLVLAALAIKLDSPGGVFYRQTRVGLNGAHYDIIKFRSMRNDAEAGGTPQWAQQNDARVTRVGHFLRQTRIDELPQILNIVKGEMSLVGPRPERPFFVEQLEEKMPFYAERHRVKPGLTGWAQIKYRYGATEEDAREKLRYDLYYVKNFNVLLDIFILMRTVRVVLWPDGVH
jgi:sugar transferase (PEP-CTERM system associated)